MPSSYIYPSASPPPDPTPLPISSRLKSFGWRQRAAPPAGFRQYAQVSTFVSTLHLIGHSYQLSNLVLDADMDEMDPEDILTVCRELRSRPPPAGEQSERVSLTLCGPIREWDIGSNGISFLAKMVREYDGFRELFIDRPLRKSHEAHATTVDHFIILLQPLSHLPHLRLLQVGSYIWSSRAQLNIVRTLAHLVPSLLVVGLLNEQAQTSWWGLWRRILPPVTAKEKEAGSTTKQSDHVVLGAHGSVTVVPLGEDHLRILEDEANAWEKRSFGISQVSIEVKEAGVESADVEMMDGEQAEQKSNGVEASSEEGVSSRSGTDGGMSLNRILSI